MFKQFSTTDSSKWLPTLHLDIHDKDICESGVWLNDNHMQAAQNLLLKQFPHVQGLQLTVYYQGNKWTPMTSGGVQLLNQSNTHWLCVSTIECSPSEVALYDSLLSKTKVHLHIIKQIAAIPNTKKTYLTIKIMHSQGQTGTNDCGLQQPHHCATTTPHQPSSQTHGTYIISTHRFGTNVL